MCSTILLTEVTLSLSQTCWDEILSRYWSNRRKMSWNFTEVYEVFFDQPFVIQKILMFNVAWLGFISTMRYIIMEWILVKFFFHFTRPRGNEKCRVILRLIFGALLMGPQQWLFCTRQSNISFSVCLDMISFCRVIVLWKYMNIVTFVIWVKGSGWWIDCLPAGLIVLTD